MATFTEFVENLRQNINPQGNLFSNYANFLGAGQQPVRSSNPQPTGSVMATLGATPEQIADASSYYADPFRRQNAIDAALEAKLLEEEARKKAAEAAALGMLSSGGSSTMEDPNPEWTNMSDAEKAAFYAENPTMGYITNLGQQFLANGGIGALGFVSPIAGLLGGLFKAQDPDIQTRASLIALGIDPSSTSNMNALGAIANQGYAGLANLGYSPMQQVNMIRNAINSRAETQAPAPVEDIGSMVGYQSSGGGYNPSSYTSGGNSNDGDGSGGYSLGGFFSGRGESGD